MSGYAFVADNTIPGLSAAEIFRRAARSVVSFGKVKSTTTGIDLRLLRDIGLDRGAAE